MIAATDCTASPVVEAPYSGLDNLARQVRVFKGLCPACQTQCRHLMRMEEFEELKTERINTEIEKVKLLQIYYGKEIASDRSKSPHPSAIPI